MPLIDGGWRTIFDQNFASLPSQTFSTDTSYTFGGHTVNKTNSASDATALANVNGSGLVFQPSGASTDIFSGTFSATCLAWPLNQFMSVTPGTMFRLWMYVPSDNLIANYDQIDIGLGAGLTTATMDFNLTAKMESTGTASQHRWRLSANHAGGNLANSTTQPARSFTDNVMVVVIRDVYQVQYHAYSGTYSGGNWPAFSSLNTLHSFINTNSYTDWSTTANITNWNVFLASGRVTSATSLACTVGRMRIDVANNP